MPQSLAHIALIVRDYDEAIAWFAEKLGFTLVAREHQARVWQTKSSSLRRTTEGTTIAETEQGL